MKRSIRLGILSAVMILGGGSLYAAPQGPDSERQAGGPPPDARCEMGAPGQGMQQPRPPRLDREQLKQAGATEAQIQALTEADFNQREKQIDLRARAEKAGLALERLMAGADVDEKAVLAAADALNQAQGDLFKLELASQLKRKQILGDELMRKLHAMRPPEQPSNQMPGVTGQGTGPQDAGNRLPLGQPPRMGPNSGQRPQPPPEAK